MKIHYRKVLRFSGIYGWRRTLYKAAARSRRNFGPLRPWHGRARDVAILGCGQFAFATIGAVLCAHRGNCFVDCFDPDERARDSFARFYRIDAPARDPDAAMARPDVDVVYIASNHASHTDYAVRALAHGKRVYVEKPVSVDWNQARRLFAAAGLSPGRIFAGYNRPFSAAIRDLRRIGAGKAGPISMTCTVLGHALPPEHWYRQPDEGTRICGNVGHWLDLAMHVIRWSGGPRDFEVTLGCSNDRTRDDDLSITLSTERGDLVCIVLTARSEPFEGINETIVYQEPGLIAKIDDFRSMAVWREDEAFKFRYWPKDVGHNAAILQPFSDAGRPWAEIEESTLLMLFVTDMVRNGTNHARFRLAESRARLVDLIPSHGNRAESATSLS
jgi:predicted dehydrogenase